MILSVPNWIKVLFESTPENHGLIKCRLRHHWFASQASRLDIVKILCNQLKTDCEVWNLLPLAQMLFCCWSCHYISVVLLLLSRYEFWLMRSVCIWGVPDKCCGCYGQMCCAGFSLARILQESHMQPLQIQQNFSPCKGQWHKVHLSRRPLLRALY